MSDPTLKLISAPFCPYGQRPRIVMLAKKIAHAIEYIDIQHLPEWFQHISPLNKVPVLLVDGQPLFESLPICEYLDEITPGSLYPADPLRRAQHRAWLEFGNEILGQHSALMRARDETAFKQARSQFAKRLAAVEEVLGEGPYFNDQHFGMVDVVYAPIFRFLSHLKQMAGLELIPADTPKVTAWANQLLSHPAVNNAVPASFPEDYAGLIRRQRGLLSQRLSLEVP